MFSMPRRDQALKITRSPDSSCEKVLRFSTDLHVSFSRAGSERHIRTLTIRLKVFSVLPTMASATALCRLRSHFSTASKQG